MEQKDNEQEKTFLEKNKKDIRRIIRTSFVLLLLSPVIIIWLIYSIIKMWRLKVAKIFMIFFKFF